MSQVLSRSSYDNTQRVSLYGVDFDVTFDYEPSDGDNWNEPYHPASVYVSECIPVNSKSSSATNPCVWELLSETVQQRIEEIIQESAA